MFRKTAALFLNASHGIGPDLGDTGLNGPSDYPNPALAITSFYRPAEDWTVQLGFFDGVAGNPAHHGDFVGVKLDGALLIGQVEKRFGDTARVELGALDLYRQVSLARQLLSWRFGKSCRGRPRPLRLDRRQAAGEAGPEGRRFERLGPRWPCQRRYQPDGQLSRRRLVYTGPFEGRDKDEAGVAFARAGLGEGARYVGMLAGRRIGSAETAFEATYRYAATDWLNIQPDLQYVINPHGDRDIADAVVVGMRFAFTYIR